MDESNIAGASQEVLSQSEVERLLSQVAEQESSATVHKADGGKKVELKDAIQTYDFRNPVYLSAVELRKLRIQHEEFIQSLAARLSIYMRMEVSLQMSRLQTVTYQKFTETLANPTHLTIFKVEPLRGICVLDINPHLGLTIVDRLMGGAGHSVTLSRDLSEIEVALLDQAVHLIISEWCSHWSRLQDLRHVLLGHENNGQFLQTSSPDTVILVLSMEARMGDCLEQIQFGFPYSTIEPLIQKLNLLLDQETNVGGSVVATQPRWRTSLDDLTIPVTAEFPPLVLSVGELSQLKVGDVLPMEPDFANRVRLRLAKMPKFTGRLGTRGQKRAIEITHILQT